jgi:hypothetical protein
MLQDSVDDYSYSGSQHPSFAVQGSSEMTRWMRGGFRAYESSRTSQTLETCENLLGKKMMR